MGTFIGNDKNNWLIGTTGADTIKGYGGDDFLKGGGGADYIDGGTGIDTAMYTDSPTGVVVDLYHGTGKYGYAEGDRLYGIENVWGSAYRDSLYGTNGVNELRGLDGADWLVGYSGSDVLDGGSGDDFLEGGAGADVLTGGAGSDTAVYSFSPTGVTVVLISNVGQRGDAEGDTFIGVENVHGSWYNDYLAGDNNANSLSGNRGDDVLLGYDGADWLGGAEGRDELSGMNGDDRLYGQDDQDLLAGGMGRDELSGGSGADVFFWQRTDETGNTVGSADVIWDFSPAEGDRINIEAIDANVYAAGDQAFRFIGTAAFSGRPGEINYYHLDGDTYIQMQTGTSPDVEGVIRLSGIHTPEASWFVL